MCGLWAGERLVLEKAVTQYRRPERPISVSAVPFGPGTDIWRSCLFIGALFRALRALLGGIDRFIPCDIGANHCRLRHTGWEKCGHGLTSSPTKSASEGFLNELLLLFRYPPRSAAALLEGTLPLRYCAGWLACKIPTFVAGLVTEGVDIVRVEHCSHAVLPGFDGGGRVDWVVGPGGGVERVRLNRKKLQHTLLGMVFGRVHSRLRVWKRLRIGEHPGFDHVDVKARKVHQGRDPYALVGDRVGIG